MIYRKSGYQAQPSNLEVLTLEKGYDQVLSIKSWLRERGNELYLNQGSQNSPSDFKNTNFVPNT